MRRVTQGRRGIPAPCTGNSSVPGPRRAICGPVGGAGVIGRYGSGAEHRWSNHRSLGKEHPMSKNFFKNSILTVFFALLALVVPASAFAAGGAIVFSKVTEDHRIYKEGEKVLPPKAP